MKILAHRPRYIEPTEVPDFGGETSSTTEGKKPIPAWKVEELSATPKAERTEELKAEGTEIPEILSPSAQEHHLSRNLHFSFFVPRAGNSSRDT